MVSKALPLDDEDSDGEKEKKVPRLNINQGYADRFAHNMRREALHRLQELKKRGFVDSSDDDEDDESSDDGFVPPDTDARIFETLSKIKRKDPSIYSANAIFFYEDEGEDTNVPEDADKVRPSLSSNGSKPHKPVYLKDALAKQLLEDGSDLDEDRLRGKKNRVVTYADEQEALKSEFLSSAKLDNNDDEGDAFLKLRKREPQQVPEGEAELASYDKDIAQRLEEYFGKDDNLDENDKFLKEFLLKKGWVDEDEDRIPSYEEVVGEVIEDREELEIQERFEAEYNFRFEEGAGSQVMGHSRVVEDSVRRKDDSRREKREKKKERLSEAAFERREELKRLKNIKKKEILERLKKIQTVAGVKETDEIFLEEDDLEEEFDPEEYDRKMREAFGAEYYGAKDVDEKFQGYDMDDLKKPNFEEEDEMLGLPKGWDEEVDAGNATVGFTAARKKVKELKSNDEEHDDEMEESEENAEVADGDDADVEDNDEALQSRGMSKRKKKAKISLREKLAFDKQLEEYYKLDYEDMIGDLPTRFKYRQIKPSMYGLSAAEILAADDKDLNQFVSLKKIAPYVTQEWKPKWRFQVSQKTRKKKALKQHKSAQKVSVDGKSSSKAQPEELEQGVSEAEGSKRKRKRRKKGLSLSESRLIAYGKISQPSKKRKQT
ncbi:hypothetical protein GOP47_0019181 [Adiantum capillus-veneris]|uniref:Kri1-like C-terminal domain-containing protein n=1 Tax=Adiantum capillus-veneris TaxID=13818 RepID=A0A9D4UF43_ADICA|nr:hypothetical protein GOP47_0019181 [Adiantum capillus-veneris]